MATGHRSYFDEDVAYIYLPLKHDVRAKELGSALNPGNERFDGAKQHNHLLRPRSSLSLHAMQMQLILGRTGVLPFPSAKGKMKPNRVSHRIGRFSQEA